MPKRENINTEAIEFGVSYDYGYVPGDPEFDKDTGFAWFVTRIDALDFMAKISTQTNENVKFRLIEFDKED